MIPVYDSKTEAEILAYHVGREGAEAKAQEPTASEAEVRAELRVDLWTALQQGAG